MSIGISTLQTKDFGLYKNGFSEDHQLDEGLYSLEIGGPGVAMLRTGAKLMMKATETRLKLEISGEGDLMQYGSLLGDPSYRVSLAKFLTEQYGDQVDSKTLMTTSGATMGLSVLLSTLFEAGDYAFLEDPTYFQVARITRDDLKLNVVPVPLDDEGIDVKCLVQEIELRKPTSFQPTADKPFWAMLYIIPIYQNPTGICYSSDRCKEIVKIARRHNLLVICDDVYNMLGYEMDGETYKKPPQRVFKYDDKTDDDYFGNVVSNGSFSKLLGPGLRLGWLEAPYVILGKMMENASIISGGSMNHYTSGIVSSAMSSGLLNTYLMLMKNSAKKKLDSVCDVLNKHCPKCVKYSIPKGGYFIWLELPKHMDTNELKEFCLNDYNVSFQKGKLCSPSKSFANFIRICFMYYTPQELTKAVKRLADAIRIQLQQINTIHNYTNGLDATEAAQVNGTMTS